VRDPSVQSPFRRRRARRRASFATSRDARSRARDPRRIVASHPVARAPFVGAIVRARAEKTARDATRDGARPRRAATTYENPSRDAHRTTSAKKKSSNANAIANAIDAASRDRTRARAAQTRDEPRDRCAIMSTPTPRNRDGRRDRRRANADAFESVVVRKNETLSAFAKRTGTRAEVILLLNPHASAKGLISGMVLDVPLKAKTEKTAKTAKKGRSASTNAAASANDARGGGKRGGEKTTTTTTTTTSFSGKLYEKSYPVLEQRSKELQAELRARVEEFGVAAKGEKAALAGELVGKSRDKLSAWRKKMMSVVAKTTDEAAENFGARFENFKSRAGAKKPSEAAKDKRQPKKTPNATAAKDKAKADAAKEKAKQDKAKQDKKDAIAREKESTDKPKKVETNKAVAAKPKLKADRAKPRRESTSINQTGQEVAWTLLFSAGLGAIGHVLKKIGEKYHIAESDDDEVREFNPTTLWQWARDNVVFRPCLGGGICVTIRDKDEDPDAPVQKHPKVGSQLNHIASTNFAEHAAPVEKAMVRRVEKTKAQLQTFMEAMKIRNIDEHTEQLLELQEELERGQFESQQERAQCQEKIVAIKTRLAEAQGLLSMWVDHSANDAYLKNLKRRVLAAWVELLQERYVRQRIMTKVYLRWQNIELSQAFNQWYENAHVLRVQRLRKEGMDIQDKLKLERQRLEEKRAADQENRMRWSSPKNAEAARNEARRSAFEEKLASAAADSLVE
jgi:LysM repeat protein